MADNKIHGGASTGIEKFNASLYLQYTKKYHYFFIHIFIQNTLTIMLTQSLLLMSFIQSALLPVAPN